MKGSCGDRPYDWHSKGSHCHLICYAQLPAIHGGGHQDTGHMSTTLVCCCVL